MNPCESNDKPIVKNNLCKISEFSNEPIDEGDGYCVHKTCWGKKDIQKFRIEHGDQIRNRTVIRRGVPLHLQRQEDHTNQGDFIDPYSQSRITNLELLNAGIDENMETYDEDDDIFVGKRVYYKALKDVVIQNLRPHRRKKIHKDDDPLRLFEGSDYHTHAQEKLKIAREKIARINAANKIREFYKTRIKPDLPPDLPPAMRSRIHAVDTFGPYTRKKTTVVKPRTRQNLAEISKIGLIKDIPSQPRTSNAPARQSLAQIRHSTAARQPRTSSAARQSLSQTRRSTEARQSLVQTRTSTAARKSLAQSRRQ